MLTGGVQLTPFRDFEKTMSFCEQPGRVAQSGQASTMPSAPISALGSGAARRPGGLLKVAAAILVPAENVAPPSLERTADSSSSKIGTTSVPSGSATG
jgi:hypothetical protein